MDERAISTHAASQSRFRLYYPDMKLQAEIGDKHHQIELTRDGAKVSAIIDGKAYDVEISEPEPNIYLIKNDGKVFEAYVAPTSPAGQPTTVTVRGREIEVRLIDPKRLRGFGEAGEHGDGLAEIKTAMPGKVVRILVEAGETIKKGDGVLVVEAMKMQNELKSPKDGTVANILVIEGATVIAGQPLAVIE